MRYRPPTSFCSCFDKNCGTIARLTHLILVLVVATTVAAGNTAGTSATEGGAGGEVNVLLGVHANHDGGHVAGLVTNADVTLTDQGTGVVDGLGETELEDLANKT